MRYTVTCDDARTRGAIDIFYKVSESFEVDTAEAAEEAFREKYETRQPLEIKITPRDRFVSDYGMPVKAVGELVRLAKKAGDYNTHYSNGDRHPMSVTDDKNEHAQNWGNDVDRMTNLIAELVKPYGFTAVVYTGLGPTLKRGEQFVEVPY